MGEKLCNASLHPDYFNNKHEWILGVFLDFSPLAGG